MRRSALALVLVLAAACGTAKQAPDRATSAPAEEETGGEPAPAEAPGAGAGPRDSFSSDPTGPSGGLHATGTPGALGPAAAKVGHCTRDCIARRQKDAISIDAIERQCKQDCVDECVTGCARERERDPAGADKVQAECKTTCGG